MQSMCVCSRCWVLSTAVCCTTPTALCVCDRQGSPEPTVVHMEVPGSGHLRVADPQPAPGHLSLSVDGWHHPDLCASYISHKPQIFYSRYTNPLGHFKGKASNKGWGDTVGGVSHVSGLKDLSWGGGVLISMAPDNPSRCSASKASFSAPDPWLFLKSSTQA